MRNKIWMFNAGFFALLWVMASSVPVLAQPIERDAPPLQKTMPWGEPKTPELEGNQRGESFSQWPRNAENVVRAEIVYVNERDQKVTIRDVATGMQFDTRVSDRSTLGSFAPGDRVRVTFSAPDRMTATSIVIDQNWKE